MSTVQKIIKALAIALATFIIFSIISTIASIIFSIAGVNWFFNWLDDENISNTITTEDSFDIEEIKDINLNSSIEKIEIIESNEFKVVAENVPETYECIVEDETLVINSRANNHFKLNNVSKIKIYVPKDFVFDNANLSLGVGEADINYLKTNILDLNCGTGEVDIDYIEATQRAVIKCGVGEFDINESKLANLEFKSGVGEVSITSELTGDCKINSGIGELNIKLRNFDDLLGKITTKKGIGELNVNGRHYSGEQVFGAGNDPLISIDGGIGEINIEY